MKEKKSEKMNQSEAMEKLYDNCYEDIPKEDIIPQKLIRDVDAWQKRYAKTGVPDCINCETPMKMAVDSITKKKSKYLWKYQCKCHKPGIQLALG